MSTQEQMLRPRLGDTALPAPDRRHSTASALAAKAEVRVMTASQARTTLGSMLMCIFEGLIESTFQPSLKAVVISSRVMRRGPQPPGS